MKRSEWFRRQRRNPRHFRRTIIAKSAIQAFMDRSRDDFSWIKQLPVQELQTFVLGEWNAFHTTPRVAQFACFAIGMEQHHFLFNLDCGLGKTKLVLDLIRYHRLKNLAARWLLLMPNIVNVQAWEDQIALHAPDLTYQKLLGSREQRHALVNERVDLCLLNYAGLQSYMTELDRDEGRRIVNRDAAQGFADLFDGVVFDESHNVGNQQSLLYRMCKRLSRACRFRYGLTATLFGYDPGMMWTQFDLVDHGYSLGETLALYRAAFFHEVQDYWKGVAYHFDNDKKDLLNRFIQHRSLRYSAEECGDVPQVSRIKERLTWSDEALLYYNQVRAECKIAGKEARLNPNAYIRMRQITSGFIGYESDDGKAKLAFDNNPKLERLLQIIDEMPLDTKLIVYHEYQFTGALIRGALAKKKVEHAEMWGGVKDAASQYRRFLRNSKCRVMVANYRMVAGGNPHEVASYAYYFESPPDPITRKQSEERVNRPGQKRKVFIYDPVLPNSVDEQIQAALASGQDFYQQVVEGKATTV